MATILTRPWTAANGTSWESVGFLKVLGGAVVATVESNAGHCGASTAERVFMVLGYPGTPGHKVAVDVIWINAVGSGRAPGVGARWTDDGANGYMAQLDSNINAARVRIRRRRAGAWTDLTGWVDISGAVTGAALEAGVTLELRTVNEEGQVALSFRVAGTERLAYDDTAADRIEAAGSPAIYIDAVSDTNDVVYDSLTVRDLEDEYTGTLADLDEGIALVVDGVSYSWEDLVDAGVVVGQGSQSYDRGDGWEFTSRALMDAEDEILYPGAVVAVALDGDIVASGRIQAASRKLQPGEGRAYRLVTARQLAADVLLEHPELHGNSITWNLYADHADYDAAYADTEIGEAIALILDEHADGSTGLRAHLAAPPDEDTAPYVQAELDLLTAKVPGMTVSGDPVTAIEQLLAFTKYLLVIDPATLIWHIVDRTGGTIVQVDLDATHVLGEYTIDPDRNFTACVVHGSKPETTETTLTSEALGGLQTTWHSTMQTGRTDELSVKNRDEGLVASIGGGGGAPTMTPDTVGPPAFSMVQYEWIKCAVVFNTGAEAGERYEVTSNTSLAFTLVGPWRNGGPAAGDEFVVEGNAVNGGRDNGHTEVGRRWKLTDEDLGVPEDACVYAKVRDGNLQKIVAAKIVPSSSGSGGLDVMLDLPAIGLVSYPPAAVQEPCDAGGTDLATVEITLPTYSISDPRVPRRWFPRDASDQDAYRGTAFTTDDAKWDGAGTPGRGDPGVMRPLLMDAPSFDGSAEQIAEWDAVFEEMLAFMATLARSVVIEVPGLDTQWAGLGLRLQLVGGPAELETITDLTVLAVEWNVPANKTKVYAGTLAAGPYDIQRMREEMVGRNVKRRQKRQTGLLDKLRDCLASNQHSAGYARDLAPVQICADRITLPGSPGARLGETLNQECQVGDSCEMSCTDFPCETVTGAVNFEANAQALIALTPSTKDAAGVLAFIAQSLACLWRVVGGIASSHDQELHKANTDLASVRTNLDAIVACINSQDAALCAEITSVNNRITCLVNWINNTMRPAYNTCFMAKANGSGSGCDPGAPNCPTQPCDVTPACAHTFTETVCEEACQQDVPDIGDYGGCTEA